MASPANGIAAEPGGGPLSEDFPNRPGGYGPGSVLAGYRLESQVGRGTTFRIWLPLHERKPRLLEAPAHD